MTDILIYADFFIRLFLGALAWCLAFFISAGLAGWGAWTLVTSALGRGR